MITLLLILWCLQLYLTFYYVMPSGSPQLTDAILVILIGLSIVVELARGATRNSHCSESRYQIEETSYDWQLMQETVEISAFFVLFVMIVNFTWACVLGTNHRSDSSPDVELLKTSMYYLYNWTVCLLAAFLISLSPLRFSFWTMITAFFAVLTQLVLTVLLGDSLTWNDTSRMVLFCNDPNQLCFAVILVSTLYYACSLPHRSRFSWLSMTDCIVTISMILVCWRAESRAGLISAALLGFFLCRNSIWFYIAVGICCLLCAGFLNYSVLDLVNDYVMDAERVSEAPSDLRQFIENRELIPLFEKPEYLILGAGERGQSGLQSMGYSSELHNSWAAVWFSYGIFGIAILSALFVNITKHGGFRAIHLLLPVLLMASSIQGLRHTEFWILLVVVSTLYCSRKASEQVPTLSQLRIDLGEVSYAAY